MDLGFENQSTVPYTDFPDTFLLSCILYRKNTAHDTQNVRNLGQHFLFLVRLPVNRELSTVTLVRYSSGGVGAPEPLSCARVSCPHANQTSSSQILLRFSDSSLDQGVQIISRTPIGAAV